MPPSLLLASLIALPSAAQVRVQGAPEVVPAVGGQAGAAQAGPTLGQPLAPLSVPSLSAPLTPSVVVPVVSPQAGAAANAAPAAALARPAPAKAAGAVALAAPTPSVALPKAAAAAPSAGLERAAESASARAGDERAGASGAAGLSNGVAQGRALFDGAAPAARNGVLNSVLAPARSLWSGVRTFLRGADQAPSFPTRPDQKVRVAGKTYTLGPVLASEPGWSLHALAGFGRSEEAVLVFSPEAKEAFAAEKAALEALGKTDIPHPQLKAAGDGVLVLVQRNLDGWDTAKILKDGIRKTQVNGLADLAARMVRLSVTADLRPDSVIWEHWRGHWALRHGTGYRAGTAWDTLSQLWTWGGGVSDRASFMSALRGRLGPDSDAWRKVVSEAPGPPELKAALDEMARRDAARAPPAALSFERGRADAVFSDEVVSPGALAKKLGYAPESVRSRTALHADDPGKLNTQVALLSPEGKRRAVYKGADLHIVRNELFVRKVIKAFFSRYFETPGALAVLNGMDSYMVMEEAPGSKSWTGPKLTREQRAALGVLVHTFGLGDMNPGNLLFGDKVWLIDFEQALSRRSPSSNRIPDERILQEMPWVDAKEPPPVEDFLPAVRQWRAFFNEAGTQESIGRMLAESGYTPEETARGLSVFRANVSQLEWTLQADVDFADGLRRR